MYLYMINKIKEDKDGYLMLRLHNYTFYKSKRQYFINFISFQQL